MAAAAAPLALAPIVGGKLGLLGLLGLIGLKGKKNEGGGQQCFQVPETQCSPMQGYGHGAENCVTSYKTVCQGSAAGSRGGKRMKREPFSAAAAATAAGAAGAAGAFGA